MFDPQLYRDKAEIEEWKKRDPIPTSTQRGCVSPDMLHDEDLAAIEAEVEAEIDEAVAFAEAGRWEPVEELTRFVYV